MYRKDLNCDNLEEISLIKRLPVWEEDWDIPQFWEPQIWGFVILMNEDEEKYPFLFPSLFVMFLLSLALSSISLFLSQSFLVCSSFVPRSTILSLADLPLTLALSSSFTDRGCNRGMSEKGLSENEHWSLPLKQGRKTRNWGSQEQGILVFVCEKENS